MDCQQIYLFPTFYLFFIVLFTGELPVLVSASKLFQVPTSPPHTSILRGFAYFNTSIYSTHYTLILMQGNSSAECGQQPLTMIGWTEQKDARR